MADGRQFTRDLPVRLNDEELQLYGKLLAIKVQEEAAVDDQRKQIGREYSTRLGAIRCEQARLADARSKGLELRPVECTERWHSGMIEIVRSDTDEVVESRPVTPADQQIQIPGLDDDPGLTSVPGGGLAGVLPFCNYDTPAEVGEMGAGAFGDRVFVGAESTDAPEPFNPPSEKAKKGKKQKAEK